MVHVASFLGAVLFAGVASALPRPDSAIGSEVAVSAPNGIILSDTAALASRSAEASATAASASSSVVLTSSASSSAATGNSYYSSSSDSSSVATQTMDSSYGSNYTPPSWSYSAPPSMQTYGSGYNSWGWGGSSYDSCVSQCIAEFGAAPSTYTPPPYTGSQSSGNNHTVIVAPMQGVLRFVPPIISAQPGDTVHYVWMAKNHTVTKSSQLFPCNKTDDHPFASGTHDAPFSFDETVNDTSPVFFYCGTPGHCEKGMWGTINPPLANNTNTSVSSMMPMMISNDSSLSAMWSYTNMMASKYNASSDVMNWGGKYDVSSMPEWAQGDYMSNIMYTRMFLAMNPEVLGADGKIDMTGVRAPLSFPADNTVPTAQNNAASSSDASSASSSPSGSAASASQTSDSSSSASTPSGSATPNGAAGTAVSSAFLAAAVFAISYLAL
jgi:plastocyanin